MKIKKIFCSLILVSFALSLVGCGVSVNGKTVTTIKVDDNIKLYSEINGEYEEGVILIKTDLDKDSITFEDVPYKSITPLYTGSKWYKVILEDDVNTLEAYELVNNSSYFEDVDLDYIMKSQSIETVDLSGDTVYIDSVQRSYYESQGIIDAWQYEKDNGLAAGGSPDVVVAIIDTGVDYNHIDLRNNIWINSAEIPNNGIDDDHNGYVDDYYGWDFVGNNNNPIDDNGHGTHVAGIVVAENNEYGITGIAYNCKVMCLKAGNSSGYFNNSDIAEAIQYAYMNGASVINMSFGGSSISTAVNEALEYAYNQCVLVAAAGNDGYCNEPDCPEHKPFVKTIYPAALPYVIGVMSTNSLGTYVSIFSNFDHNPNNSFEYEVYACGEEILSTWPNNKVARMSGTSMASPVVASIAALLRSNYADREVYSNKFIQSQIVNTGSINPSGDIYHNFSNSYEALAKKPKPSISLYDYYIFDNNEISPFNNGNGIIDAGETIHLAIELINHGGVASSVVASIDTIRNNDPSLIDRYVTIVNESISLGNIGTYSIRDCGKTYDGETVIGTVSYFELIISNDCPNDYLCKINLKVNYENDLDSSDQDIYLYNSACYLSVYSGTPIPDLITEDMVLDSTKEYTVSGDVVIAEGATLTILGGTSVRFYANSNAYYSNSGNIWVKCYGNLQIQGTAENHASLLVNETIVRHNAFIASYGGNITVDYADTERISFSSKSNKGLISISNSNLIYDDYFGGVEADYLTNCYVQTSPYVSSISCRIKTLADSNYFRFGYTSSSPAFTFNSATITNNVFELVKDARGNAVDIVLNQTILNNNVFINEGDYSSGGLHINNSNNNNSIINNHFLGSFAPYEKVIFSDYYNSSGQPNVVKNEDYESDEIYIYPFIKDIFLYDKDNNKTKTISKEPVSVKIIFNRDMNVNSNLSLFYGSMEPFADYKINGEFIDSRTWEGHFEVKSFIENGTQFFTVSGAKALNGLLCYDKGRRYTFDINFSSTLSMNLQAHASSEGMNLEWVQDDYDTLMGYNVYRSSEKDGYFTKLNSAVIPAGENTFLDENAAPGKTYWYTFTVVFSDMSESNPAGKVVATMLDTEKPSIYHTPVNQGYLNNNLVISCTASDNVGISSVILYYRTIGGTIWKTLTMSKQNDRYSVTIFGSELSLDGLEYYIIASDGVNTVNKGNEDNPYSVIIKDASAISKIGDVDGDGVVTTRDALMIMQAINGDLLLSDDEFRRADLNNDGVLSSVEALRILQYINGNVSTLEM